MRPSCVLRQGTHFPNSSTRYSISCVRTRVRLRAHARATTLVRRAPALPSRTPCASPQRCPGPRAEVQTFLALPAVTEGDDRRTDKMQFNGRSGGGWCERSSSLENVRTTRIRGGCIFGGSLVSAFSIIVSRSRRLTREEGPFPLRSCPPPRVPAPAPYPQATGLAASGARR